MTGFGRAAAGRVLAEIRSVNHRYLDVVCRLPRELAPFEDRVRRLVAGALRRARVEVTLQLERRPTPTASVRVDKDLALAYHEALKELAGSLAVPWQPDPGLLVRLPGVVLPNEPPEDGESLWPDVEAALAGAVAGVRAMRRAEGAALAADLSARAGELGTCLEVIAARAPLVAGAWRDRLRRRMDEVLGAGVVDPERLAAEAALFADRVAVDEEIVRLQSHLERFRATLAAPLEVGRKLDFIVQELHRELNTIAAKAGDAEMAGTVLEAKSICEKLREQVQNIA